MPAPDPEGVTYYEEPDGCPRVMTYSRPNHCLYFPGNVAHRVARARAILRKLRYDGWTCPQCGRPVPMERRADAVYCREACRKRHARGRRHGINARRA